MRSAAKKLNVGVPDFCEAQTAMEAIELSKDFTYPLIIKPVDSSGSRGVRKVNTPDELAKYFEMTKAFSLTGNVIVEEFITGKEYLADGIALGLLLKLLLLRLRLLQRLNFFSKRNPRGGGMYSVPNLLNIHAHS